MLSKEPVSYAYNYKDQRDICNLFGRDKPFCQITVIGGVWYLTARHTNYWRGNQVGDQFKFRSNSTLFARRAQFKHLVQFNIEMTPMRVLRYLDIIDDFDNKHEIFFPHEWTDEEIHDWITKNMDPVNCFNYRWIALYNLVHEEFSDQLVILERDPFKDLLLKVFKEIQKVHYVHSDLYLKDRKKYVRTSSLNDYRGKFIRFSNEKKKKDPFLGIDTNRVTDLDLKQYRKVRKWVKENFFDEFIKNLTMKDLKHYEKNLDELLFLIVRKFYGISSSY